MQSENPVYAEMLKELKKIKNELVLNNAVYFLSDITPVSYSINTEALAESNVPAITLTTPNFYIDVIGLAIGWDSTAGSNYKFNLSVGGSLLSLDTTKYKQLPLASPFNFIDGFKVRFQPSTTINLRLYNYNSATSDGNVVLFLIGDIIKQGESNV
jgi:hypothetical protein